MNDSVGIFGSRSEPSARGYERLAATLASLDCLAFACLMLASLVRTIRQNLYQVLVWI
jgi:hypothetical protein